MHTHSILQDISLTSQITLTNTKEKLKCRKVKAVIRYHTPNKTKQRLQSLTNAVLSMEKRK